MEQRDVQADTTAGHEAETMLPPCPRGGNRGLPQVAPGGPLPMARAWVRLADSLFVSPVSTIPQAQATLGVSYPTAQPAVRRLTGAGILQQAGTLTYGRTFIAPDILAAIGESEE